MVKITYANFDIYLKCQDLWVNYRHFNSLWRQYNFDYVERMNKIWFDFELISMPSKLMNCVIWISQFKKNKIKLELGVSTQYL